MNLFRTGDHAGSIGAVLAAMGCASCFPALGGLGAAIGLGFLAQFEGTFINIVLPFCAALVWVANLINGLSHRRWGRMMLGIAGPSMVLATLYLFWTDDWSTWMFYAGLIFMLASSTWDLVSPARPQCATRQVSPHTNGTA